MSARLPPLPLRVLVQYQDSKVYGPWAVAAVLATTKGCRLARSVCVCVCVMPLRLLSLALCLPVGLWIGIEFK